MPQYALTIPTHTSQTHVFHIDMFDLTPGDETITYDGKFLTVFDKNGQALNTEFPIQHNAHGQSYIQFKSADVDDDGKRETATLYLDDAPMLVIAETDGDPLTRWVDRGDIFTGEEHISSGQQGYVHTTHTITHDVDTRIPGPETMMATGGQLTFTSDKGALISPDYSTENGTLVNTDTGQDMFATYLDFQNVPHTTKLYETDYGIALFYHAGFGLHRRITPTVTLEGKLIELGADQPVQQK